MSRKTASSTVLRSRSQRLSCFSIPEKLSIYDNQFKLLTDAVPLGISMMSPDLKFIFFNPEFTKLFGYTLKDIPDKNVWFNVAYPDPAYRKKVIALWRKDLINKPNPERIFNRRVVVRCKNGRDKIIHIRSLALDDGRQLLTYQDVTRQHKMAEHCKENEQKFYKAFHHSPVLMGITTVDTGRFIDVNQAFLKTLGLKRGEVIGRTSAALGLYYDSLQRDAMLSMVKEQGFVHNFELRIKSRTHGMLHGLLSAEYIQVKGRQCLLTVVNDVTSSKQAEQVLRESEERYRSLINNTSDIIWETDADARYTFISPQVIPILGYTPQEMLGRSVFDFMVPEDIMHNQAQFKIARLQKRMSLVHRSRFVHKDGRLIFIETHAVPVVGIDDSWKGFRGVDRDITDREMVEKALRESENRYRAFFENTGTATAILNEDMTLLLVNCMFEQYTGYTKAEIEGIKQWPEFVHRDDRERSIAQHWLRRKQESEGLNQYEIRLLHRDGSVREVLLNVMMIPDTTRSLVSMLDISERKKQEQALRLSEQRYRDIFDNASEGIFQTTPGGKYLGLNPSFARMFGYSGVDEMMNDIQDIGRQVYVDPQDRERLKEELAARGAVTGYEAQVYRKDGSKIWILINARVVRDVDGKILYYEGTNEDITQRKRAEEKILASLQEKEVLVREVNHRVKNNLQIIYSLFSMQMAKLRDRKIKDILKESQARLRSIALVHEKLYQSDNLSRIDFCEYVVSLVKSLSHSFNVDAAKISMRIDISPGIFIGVDKIINCGLIINELVTNAFKYAFPGDRTGIISIALHSGDDGRHVLTVGDNGVGMPAGFAIEKTKTLGLELVWTLATQLGEIDLDAAGGTRVTVRFKE